MDFVAALLDPADWKLRGACRDRPDLDWLPERGASVAEQLAVCDRCAVRSECLAYCLDWTPAMAGIWGATTANERRRMAKVRNAELGQGAA